MCITPNRKKNERKNDTVIEMRARLVVLFELERAELRSHPERIKSIFQATIIDM